MSDISPAPPEPDPVLVVPPSGNGADVRPARAEAATSDPAAPPSEQLARIEDKVARIEEKFARSEAAMQRVVDRFDLASARMGEVALQSDLASLRSEVAAVGHRLRRSIGLGSLVVTAILTAILTAAAVLLVMRYAPAALAR